MFGPGSRDVGIGDRIAARGAQDTWPECEPGEERDDGSKRYPEMPGQSYKAGRGGQRNRSHRPRPWIFPAPSVACPDLVRGLSRSRPWFVRSSFVARSASVGGPHGPRTPALTDA